MEITSVGPKNPPSFYDNFKIPINNWRGCGLDEPSFVKCRNIHNVEGIRLHDHIGTMDPDEFGYITDKIDEFNP